MSKEPKPTTTELVKKLVEDKLDSGFEIIDNDSIKNLYKSVIDELHLSKNWRSKARDIINDVMRERDIIVSSGGKHQIKSMVVRLKKPEQPPPEPTQQSTPSIPSQSPHGTLPMQESKPHGTLPTPEQIQQTTRSDDSKLPMSESEKEQTKRINKKIFVDFVGKTYVKLGIIPDDSEEVEEKPKSQKDAFLKDCGEFADELTTYCIEHNVKLPRVLELLSLGGGFFMIFMLPLVKVMFFNPKVNENSKPKYDKKLDKVQT